MASQANPYAAYLGTERAENVISETQHRLTELVQKLGEDGLKQSYAPGKWTAQQIVCHLADVEIAFAFRLRQALAEPNHVIQPFDQERWADAYVEGSLQAQAALEVFMSVRGWNLRLLKGVPPEKRMRPVVHPERGNMTFQTIVETMGGHDINHMRQLEAIAAGRG